MVAAVRGFQETAGIRKPEVIYLGDQPHNQDAYAKVIGHLSSVFDASRTTVIYRLLALGRLIDRRTGLVGTTWRTVGQAFLSACGEQE
jgi:hypothetical protein